MVIIVIHLQETIGKATAVKYPTKKTSTLAEQGGVVHRKIAGQTSSTGPAHLRTVKVVDWYSDSCRQRVCDIPKGQNYTFYMHLIYF